MSRYEYPEDEFDAADDEGPVPVGVHRAPVPGWRSWVPLLAVLIIVPLLAWGAVQLLGRHGARPAAEATAAAPASGGGGGSGAPASGGQAPATGQPPATATPTNDARPTSAPTNADLTTGVTIHNGAGVNGLGARTGDRLRNVGYTNVEVQQGTYDNASPTTTTIFYADSGTEATARAVGQALGITNIVESAAEAQSNPIVIVLRTDFEE
mgnify:CR=1 FL=1